MADARVLMLMVGRPDIAAIVAEDAAVTRQLLSVAQLVDRKLQNEKRYLARLEGENNSAFKIVYKLGLQCTPSLTRAMSRVSNGNLPVHAPLAHRYPGGLWRS